MLGKKNINIMSMLKDKRETLRPICIFTKIQAYIYFECVRFILYLFLSNLFHTGMCHGFRSVMFCLTHFL